MRESLRNVIWAEVRLVRKRKLGGTGQVWKGMRKVLQLESTGEALSEQLRSYTHLPLFLITQDHSRTLNINP